MTDEKQLSSDKAFEEYLQDAEKRWPVGFTEGERSHAMH